MILESKNVEYQVIDITEPGKEAEKEFMQLNSTAKDSKYPLPPQIFNEEDYCGVSFFLIKSFLILVIYLILLKSSIFSQLRIMKVLMKLTRWMNWKNF